MSYVTQPVSAVVRRSTVSHLSHEWPQVDEQYDQGQNAQRLRIHSIESWLYAKIQSLLRQEQSALPIVNPQNHQWFQSAVITAHITGSRRVQYSRAGPSRSTTTSPNRSSGSSTTPKKSRKLRFSRAVDPRKVSHETRKTKLKEILHVMLNEEDANASWILLCWGTSINSLILPVKIINSYDEKGIWQEINRAWYSHRGWWRKCIPLLKVKEADIVELSIAGQDQRSIKNPKFRNIYVGEFTKQDLCAKKQRLEQDIDGYQPQVYPCPYNPTIGEVNCNGECRSWSDLDSRCPEDRLFEAERNLARLNLRSQLKFAFTQPHSAALFDLLSRELVLSQLDILRKLDTWHCPELGELRFPGLLISEGWELDPQHILLPLSTTALFIMVVAAKFIYGDWAIAWNVGSFLVSLAALLWMWANHCVA
ncbi:hypothetical protein BDV27DRAFT_42740 [Aspergillus caelatus]|uniref:Uncharacterized protein n=1 Tax=Aspergillus caelatus TaxID=61420 RepID=A0A5N7AF38_9EURO|nr:uncharacterized protein BDV27DRAFT_42740 [Aspergillus caelatus]KAE8368477.1 hypothetical protein BDV27DRAFT_42740 [Aspergillus caelatus]